MDKDSFLKIFDNPDFISGIHNYCDRWCERCTMTSRCSSFAIEEARFPDKERKDPENEEFWDGLHDIFQITLELVTEMAEERGIDLSSIDVDDEMKEHEEIKLDTKKRSCVKNANKYTKSVDTWFDDAKELLKQKEQELNKQLELNLPSSDPISEAATLTNIIEIIRWYQHQIYVKLMRAVTGKLEGVPEIIADMPKDSDGSAKVALIGTDRSIAAWGAMMKHFPEKESTILDILVLLEKTRKQTEIFFPDARNFKRPGFDE